jgi:hypothetical protein
LILAQVEEFQRLKKRNAEIVRTAGGAGKRPSLLDNDSDVS